MPQLLLDPETIKSNPPSERWTPDGPLPQCTRDFGCCIDFGALLPGDLILVSSVFPGFIGRAIRKVQKKGGYSDDDACWEHAAIYIQGDTICEATRSGVQIGSLFEYIGAHKIRVRRNPGLTQDKRWNLVVNALQQRDYAYGFGAVVGLCLKAHIGFWKPNGGKPLSFPKRAVYCSELYADAHVKACGVALGNLKSGETTPASLSLDSTLQDVQVGWLKIS